MQDNAFHFDSAPYIARASFVVSFVKEADMRYKAREIEQYFREIAASQSVATNVPDNAPEQMPRITMQSGSKSISVSQITAQLDFDFSESPKAIADTMATIDRNGIQFWNGVEKLRGRENMRHAGLVVTVYTPSSLSLVQINQTIFKRYIRIEESGSVASAGFRIGFLDAANSIFRNYGLDSYELREGTVDATQAVNGRVKIDIASIPVKQRGFELKVDVNSKPLADQPAGTTANHASVVLREMRKALESNADGLLLTTREEKK